MFIYPGRMQPPHRDHVAFLRDVAHAVHALGETLWVGLIVPRYDLECEHPLARRSAAHHLPERNPFTYEERAQMLAAALPELVGSVIRTVPLPPPERAWSAVEQLFTAPRIWIVPRANESFDEAKAAFFTEKGDAVIRPAQRVTTNGHVVRQLLAKDDPSWMDHVPSPVAEIVADRLSRTVRIEPERPATFSR